MGKTSFNMGLFGRIAVLVVLFMCSVTALNAQDAASLERKQQG